MTYNLAWSINSTTYENDIIKQNYIDLKEEFESEKKAIADAINFINFNNPNSSNYKPFLMIIGGQMLAFDDGKNNLFGGFPIATCGALNWRNKGKCKGGPYTHGYSKDIDDQYCAVKVYTSTQLLSTCIKVQGFLANYIDDKEYNFFTYDTCMKEFYSNNSKSYKCPILPGEKVINIVIALGAALFIFLVFFVILYKISESIFDYQILDKKGV